MYVYAHVNEVRPRPMYRLADLQVVELAKGLVQSCHEHTTNLATGVSRQPVLDCGTIFHPDCGSRDFTSILSDDL